MNPKLRLNLITPQAQLLKDLEVDMVVFPAFLGEMGILPGHVPVLVQLTMGSLRYKKGEGENEFAVMGGFVEVVDNVVTVFAEGADLAEEIDEEAESQKIKKAKEALSHKDADIDFELAELELKKSIARMKVKRRKQ